MLFGAFLEVVILGAAIRRIGYRLLPKAPSWSDAERRILGQYAPLIAGSILATGMTVIDQSMAASLGPGSVARLSYAGKVVNAAVSLSNTAMSAALGPLFARYVASSEWQTLRRALRNYSLALFAVTIPGTLLLIGLSTPIVRLLFERGSFTAAETAVVAHAQSMYFLQIPFHVVGVLFVRVLIAQSRNRVLLPITLAMIVVDVASNWFFMRRMGISGIALSTGVVYVVSMILVVWIALIRITRAERHGKTG
jgi:putative peptidoglycan lipid II flippase